MTSTLSVTEPICRVMGMLPVAGHFQLDALLHVSLETVSGGFQLIGPDRKVGERIAPVTSVLAERTC